MSSPSVAPVATGTTAAVHTNPVARFYQQVDLDLALRDMQRSVDRLQRLLQPPLRPRLIPRRSRRSAWWPSD